MKILALEPYLGGSHQAFLDGWTARSRHTWTVLGLPAHKWKWRMRHAAITLAGMAGEETRRTGRPDLVLCSDMLNLAEFLGLARGLIGRLPVVAFFHENQLTYPVRHEDQRDLHFAFTNLTTALAADRVWFNSAFHRGSFLEAIVELLARMPDYQPAEAPRQIRHKSSIQPPGIEPMPPRGPRAPGPLRILWAARWEFDKNPEEFFEALRILKSSGVDFRLSVIGQRFRDCPAVFDWAREHFREHLDRWGYQEDCREYRAALAEADLVVSTALHEFFGIGVVEAIAAGARPLLPRRLTYPEILQPLGPAAGDFLYEGGAEVLARRMEELAGRMARGDFWRADPSRLIRAVARFHWDARAEAMDRALEEITA